MSPIDAKTSMIINCLFAVAGVIVGFTAPLTQIFGTGVAQTVVAAAGMAAAILGTINAVLHGYSSSGAGPMVPSPPAPPAAPKTATAILLLIAGTALLGLLCGGEAHAQNGPPRQVFRPTGNLPADIKAATQPSTPAATGQAVTTQVYDSIGGELQKVAKDTIDKAILDLTAASTDAKGTSDLISQPCWDAQVSFLKLLPAEWPAPPADVGPALAIQIGRDLRRALTSDQQGSLKVACAALFGDELQQAGKLFSILGIRAAGLAIGLPIP